MKPKRKTQLTTAALIDQAESLANQHFRPGGWHVTTTVEILGEFILRQRTLKDTLNVQGMPKRMKPEWRRIVRAAVPFRKK